MWGWNKNSHRLKAEKLWKIAVNFLFRSIRSMAHSTTFIPVSPHENRVGRKLKLAFFICCFSWRLIKTTLLKLNSLLSHTHTHRWVAEFSSAMREFSRSFHLFSFDFHSFSVSFQRSSVNVCLVFVVPPVSCFSVLFFSQLQKRWKNNLRN